MWMTALGESDRELRERVRRNDRVFVEAWRRRTDLEITRFAADGVTTIALEDLDGRTIAEAAVRDNVDKLTAYPPGGVSALVARDAGGHTLQRVKYSR